MDALNQRRAKLLERYLEIERVNIDLQSMTRNGRGMVETTLDPLLVTIVLQARPEQSTSVQGNPINRRPANASLQTSDGKNGSLE
ncbi:hypothetical protein J6590_004195 [Homalodisca vitripennis]|nr:hypothetical protein J6590_004195 [Homalodisca vitripennis]